MARLLLDENVSAQLVPRLRSQGHDVVHVDQVGLGHTPDAVIMLWAARQGRTVITHDHDFERNLAVQGARAPSVIRLAERDRGGRGGLAGAVAQAARLRQVLPAIESRLRAGVAVTVDRAALAVAPLPLARTRPGPERRSLAERRR